MVFRQIDGLGFGNTYYVRAYATNSSGTDYGPQYIVKTLTALISISGSFTPKAKVYDGTKDAEMGINNLQLSGLVPGFYDVSLSNIILEFQQETAGLDKTVKIVSAELSGTHAHKYELDFWQVPTSKANITKKPLTVGGTFSVAPKVYDGTVNAQISSNNLELQGVVDSDDVGLTNLKAEFVSPKTGSSVQAKITVGTLNGNDNTNYSVSFDSAPTTIAAINQKELTIGGVFVTLNKVYDGSTSAQLINSAPLTLIGKVGSDKVSLTDIVLDFESHKVGTQINVNITSANLSGDDKDNYEVSVTGSPTVQANITPKPIQLSGNFSVNDKTYDGNVNAEVKENNLTPSEAIIGDEVSVGSLVAEFASRHAGENVTANVKQATLSGADKDNYTVDVTNAPTTVAKIFPKEVTLAGNFTTKNKEYDGNAQAEVTYQNLAVSGKIPIDEVMVGDIEIAFPSSEVATNVPVKIVNANLTGANNTNYTVNLDVTPTATASITPKELQVIGNFTAKTKVYDGTKAAEIMNNNLLLQGKVGTDDVSLDNIIIEFASKNVDDNIGVSITNASLSGAKQGNYTLQLGGSPSSQASITPKQLSVVGNFTVNNKVYDGNASAPITSNTLTLQGKIIGDDVQIDEMIAEFATKNVGNAILVSLADISIKGNDTNNYTVSYDVAGTTTANITTRNISIGGSFTARNKKHDGTTTAQIADNNLVLLNTVSNDDVDLDVVNVEFNQPDLGTNIPVNITNATLKGSDHSNYLLSLTGAPSTTANIMQNELTVQGTFSAENKIYDGTKAASLINHSLTLQGVESGHDVAIETVSIAFIDANVSANVEIEVTNISLSGAHANLYSVSLDNISSITGAITPKELTLGGSFTVKDKDADNTTIAEIEENNLQLVGVVGSDDVTIEQVEVHFRQSAVGQNIIVDITDATLGGTKKSNYSLSLVNAPTSVGNIVGTTGVDSEKMPMVAAYPNPFSNVIYFSSSDDIVKVTVVASNGAMVMQKELHTAKHIDVSHLKQGVYMVIITTTQGTQQVLRMVK